MDLDDLNPEQRARVAGLRVAREVLAKTEGSPLARSARLPEAVDVADLVDAAAYVVTGTHPYDRSEPLALRNLLTSEPVVGPDRGE